MNTMRGYYGLIQYCPDPSRAEAANVGVVLYCPEPGFLEVRMSRGNDRARRFFTSASLDLQRLEAAKQAFESRLKDAGKDFRSVADLEAFMLSRGNDLRLIPPRPMKVENPDSALRELFSDLVGGRSRAEKEQTRAQFRELDEIFKAPRLASKVRFNEVVTVPIIERPLQISYVFRNGRENLVLPRVFSDSTTRATGSALKLAIEGDLLKKHDNKQLIVVAGFEGPSTEKLSQHIEALFSEYQTRLVRHSELRSFAAEVEADAH